MSASTRRSHVSSLHEATSPATASAHSGGHELLSTVWNIALAAVLVAAAFGRSGGKRLSRVLHQGQGAAGGTPGVSVAFESRGMNVRFGAAVYGSFLVASVVGVAFEAGQDARVMTTTAFASALVFWLAHWWSEVIGEQISAGEDFRRRDVLVVARREWPLVEAAVVPTAFLALAWAGVWPRETGAELALGAAVLQITGWALAAGRRAGWSWLRAGLFAAIDGALGTVLLLLLEKLVH